LADVLFGKVSPAGKLTSTWPKRLEDHPTFLSFPGEHDHMPYTEDVFVGHRYFEAIE
jgi:beta-glucosidase